MRSLKIAVIVLVVGALAGCAGKCPLGACSKVAQVKLGAHSAITPLSRASDSGWGCHLAIVERVKKGNVDMVFIGDSITYGWETEGKPTWDKYYAPRNAVNMGISSDRTQHVLWRLRNGEIAGISPKLAVVMIGTNNPENAQEIADGIMAIVQELRSTLPNTKVLMLAIFPRGEKPNPQREKNEQASLIASKIADNKMVFYKDIKRVFLDNDGTLPKNIMPDFLHPNAKGYELEAAALELTLEKLMGETGTSAACCNK